MRPKWLTSRSLFEGAAEGAAILWPHPRRTLLPHPPHLRRTPLTCGCTSPHLRCTYSTKIAAPAAAPPEGCSGAKGAISELKDTQSSGRNSIMSELDFLSLATAQLDKTLKDGDS